MASAAGQVGGNRREVGVGPFNGACRRDEDSGEAGVDSGSRGRY